MAQVAAVDASVFIYAIEATAGLGPKSRQFFHRVEKGEVKAVWSTVVATEVLPKTYLSGDEDEIYKSSRLIFEMEGSQVLPVTAAIAMQAAELRARFGPRLKTPDALHLATALEAKADYFLTNDKALASLNIPEITITLLGDT